MMKHDHSRRDFLKKTSAIVLGAIATGVVNHKLQAAIRQVNTIVPLSGDKFTLPELPYAYDALEPHIDRLTMEIHYSKHHQGYVNNLNKSIETLDSHLVGERPTLNTLFENIQGLPLSVRNNAGGHYNHSLFWTLMQSKGEKTPDGKLAEAIVTNFGSFEEFKSQFTNVAMKHFGSGWAWLIKSDGKLSITSTPNQDNPLMNLATIEHKGTPILALDLWEHAYYLKNQNRRAEYLASWWKVVNWETAEKLFVG